MLLPEHLFWTIFDQETATYGMTSALKYDIKSLTV